MTIKVAINGYGRIGRNVLRAHYEGGKKMIFKLLLSMIWGMLNRMRI